MQSMARDPGMLTLCRLAAREREGAAFQHREPMGEDAFALKYHYRS